MIHHDSCPVCSSPNIAPKLISTDHTVSGESFEIWQCNDCSLRFTQNIPEAEEIGKYYQSENYISHTATNKGIINWLYLRVRQITLLGKRKLIERFTGIKKGDLLDIGAGTGAFVHYMSTAGWRVEGLEPDDGAIKRAAATYGIRLKPSSELFNINENSFDVITLWHVLEHVHGLHGYIQQIKKLCRTSGKIFIAVPNYTSFDAHYYDQSWAAYDVPRHLYHFSPQAMEKLLTLHGCSIQRIEPMWFDSYYVSMLSEKYKTGSSNIIKGGWRGFRSNYRALKDKKMASSLIYVVAI